MESRRDLLKLAILGGAALTVAPGAQAVAKPVRKDGATDNDWALFQPLVPGREIALGWSLAAIAPVIGGATILHLVSDRGESARVRICRNDGNPVGMASSKHFDLVLMNSGEGNTPTDEDLGRVLLTLTGVILKNEDRVVSPWGELKTHREHLEACNTRLA